MFISTYGRCETTFWLTLFAILIFLKLSYVSTTITHNSNTLYKPVVRSKLASKLIFESPKMDNIYNEYTVSSKPLQLRKHRNHSKVKKSKIFYLTMPSISYKQKFQQQHILNTSKIKREGNSKNMNRQKHIVMERLNKTSNNMMFVAPTTITKQTNKLPLNYYYQPQQQQQQQTTITMNMDTSTQTSVRVDENVSGNGNAITKKSYDSKLDDNQIYYLRRHDINGKPEHIHVYHAAPNNHLTPKNLKKNLYFVKKFVY